MPTPISSRADLAHLDLGVGPVDSSPFLFPSGSSSVLDSDVGGL